MNQLTKEFKTMVAGVGPYCVEYADGEIVTMRHEELQHLLAAAPKLRVLVERAQAIRHPNSGKWTKAETERSWAEWDTQARAVLAKIKPLSKPASMVAKQCVCGYRWEGIIADENCPSCNPNHGFIRA